MPLPASTTVASIIEGPLAISQGAPTFEASHTQHVWLFPQRANMIANPIFESRAVRPLLGRPTATPSESPYQNLPLSWCLGWQVHQGQRDHLSSWSPTSSPPTERNSGRSSFWPRVIGNLKVGFVWWDDDFTCDGCRLGCRDLVRLSSGRSPISPFAALP